MEDLLNTPTKKLNLNNLISLNLERHVLSALLKQPQIFPEIDTFLTDADFYNKVHQTVFCVIRNSYLKNEKLDKVLLAQKIKNLNIHFFEEVDIFDYIENLFFSNINEKAGIEACKELIKLRIRREICETADRVKEFVVRNGDKKIDELIIGSDKIYHNKIDAYYMEDKPVNLFTNIKSIIEELGNNPPSELDFSMGPFPTVNRIYGSISRFGAINLLASRTGVAKTSLSMFYTIYLAEKYNLPILHLDFSEMSVKELQIRAVCMFSKGIVPYHSIETGEYRKNAEWTKIVRNIWPRVEKLRMFYYDIGHMIPDEVINLIRRVYYKEVGRGNKLIVNYDYLKPFKFDPKLAEYRELGYFIQNIKTLINKEIPNSIHFWASLQLNRLGIINNKTSNEVDDSENAFSLSDRIIQQTTHAWIIRPKLMDEIADEHNQFGNMKLMCMKYRHLGKNYMDAINPVQISKGKFKRNYINLQVNSFHFEDRGDLNHMVEILKDQIDIDKHNDKKDDIL